MTEVKGVSQIISVKVSENKDMEEAIYLVKGDVNEYYLVKVINGWKQISETEKTWGTLIEYKYYVNQNIVPLIYYILSTNPEQLNNIFQFLYQNDFLTDEE